MQKNQFIELLMQYREGKATPEENAFLEAWYQAFELEPDIIEMLSEEEKTKLKAKTYAELLEKMGKEPAVVRRMFSRRIRYVAAAIVLFAIAGTVFLVLNKKENPVIVQSDVKAPATNRATITLNNGRIVYLDSSKNGLLAAEGALKISKTADGQIAYNGQGEDASAYILLTNPRGSKVVDLSLNDGTHVWLNAESSIKYPVAFNGKERAVEITGEAYFEVTHNAAKPFKVKVRGETIEDLGTKFNVNSYDAANITTLVEGAVKIQSTILKPGEQYQDGKVKEADIEMAMAWKNGFFHFDKTDIETVMKQVARWYDVEVVYEERPDKQFVGGAPRTMSAANVFKALEETGGVHFTIEGRKVIVRK